MRPVDSLQLSAEAAEAAPGIAPGFLSALGQSLKPVPQLPSGAHAQIRSNVEKALRQRHLSENERIRWLQEQTQEGGAMDYQCHQESERDKTQRLCDRNCGAVGTGLALRQETILKLANAHGDKNQVLDGIREAQRYLNGEPSQLGQRGRQQHASESPLALAQRLQSRDFQEIPNNAEGNRFLEQLRQQLVRSYVGQPEASPEAAMLSQQLALARARRTGAIPC